MRIGMIGVNHKLASLETREKIAKLCTRSFADCRIIHPHLAYVLLSTCNRTEIYFHASDLAEAHIYLLGFLRQGSEHDLDQRMYAFFGMDCFYHLTRVTAGLDSAIVGETEIQGQVKRAYHQAMEQRSLPSELHFLFQKSLKLAKEVRSQDVRPQMGSVLAQTLFAIATRQLGDLYQRKILLVGFSDINRTLAAWLEKKQLRHLTYCNRHDHKIKDLYDNRLPWEEKERWIEFDLIIVGTKAPYYVIEELPVPLTVDKMLVDLSVPRNVNPQLAQEKHLFLWNIDHLCEATLAHQVDMQDMDLEEERLLQAVRRQIGIFERKKHIHYPYFLPQTVGMSY